MASNASSDPAFHAKQIVFLFMAATVVAVVVFLCGVLVGRGVPLGGRLGAEPVSLGEEAMDDLPPPILSTPRSQPSAGTLTSEDLTYPDRLGRDTAMAERGGDIVEPSPPASEPTATNDPAAPDSPNDQPVVSNETADVQVPGDAVAEFESPVVPEGAYVVQVMALKGPGPAREQASRLADKGFRAFVLPPFPEEPVAYYRVQVGPFIDRVEAARIRDRIRTEEGLDPFITR